MLGWRFYEAAVAESSDCAVKVTMLINYGYEEYTGKGISEALIPEIGRALGRQVTSSSNRFPNTNEYRSDAATKVWQKLEVKGMARYDRDEDRYYLTG